MTTNDGSRVVRTEHFALWAVQERDTGRGSLGFASEEPYHQPSKRRGDADPETEDRPARAVTSQDVIIAETIGSVIARLRSGTHERRLWAEMLREAHGAYPGAPREMERRIGRAARCANVGKSSAYQMVKLAETYVVGVVETMIDSFSDTLRG